MFAGSKGHTPLCCISLGFVGVVFFFLEHYKKMFQKKENNLSLQAAGK